MAAHVGDHETLTRLAAELHSLAAERDGLEAEWMKAAALIE